MSKTTETNYVGEPLNSNGWDRYIEYLRAWADTHSDAAFCGCSPICFDEWMDNEACEAD